MLITLFFLVLAIGVIVLILLAIVVTGIRREPPAAELSSRPPGLISAIARRMLGVSVRRPGPPANDVGSQRDTCMAGHAASDEGG